MDQDFDKWLDRWDSAREKGIFKDTPKQKVHDERSDFFGNWRPPTKEDNFDIKDVDAKYWNKVYRMSSNQGDMLLAEEEVINEQGDNIWEKSQNRKLRDTPNKSGLANASAELANAANPVNHHTRGIDQRRKVTPDWSDGTNIREIANMKYQLYNLEARLNASPKFGAFGKDSAQIKSIQRQIDDLKDRIDYLSNSLSPHFISDESS